MGNLRDKDEQYWRKKLTPQQFQVLRMGATEPPFSGALYNNHKKGVYECGACGATLFSSDAKFDSGSGWPSFDEPLNREHVELREDTSHGMVRTEVLCKNCGSHLGHVFSDGPTKTGKRYCLNSAGLNFTPENN